jgi:hypothetical protein
MEPRLEQVVRVHGASTPGLLTCVAQSFSSVNIAVDSLRHERNRTDSSTAVIEIAFRSDKRTADLIRGRISRLIDVLEITQLVGFESEAEPEETDSDDSDEPAITTSLNDAEQVVLISR